MVASKEAAAMIGLLVAGIFSFLGESELGIQYENLTYRIVLVCSVSIVCILMRVLEVEEYLKRVIVLLEPTTAKNVPEGSLLKFIEYQSVHQTLYWRECESVWEMERFVDD